jgi:hypothetical protein
LCGRVALIAIAFAGLVRGAEKVTFNKDVARIVWKQCAPCHRPGQPAPFSLLSYADAQRHRRQIDKAIAEDYMPPWPPAPDVVRFENERHLSADEKRLIREWIASGAQEGDAKDLPPAPAWKDGWVLGKPDLVVTMPKEFALEAEGPDVYRNFVIPIHMERDRWVRAVEFAPGNPAVVHHAFIKVDTNAVSRRLDGRGGAVGFPGMNVPAEMPAGHFLTWQPGTVPMNAPEGSAWRLAKESDLVLQVHLNRTGKPEAMRSSVALYFTDAPPTNRVLKIGITSLKLHFPPGASNDVVTKSFTWPVAVRLLGILPHAHNLAREIEVSATLPSGKREPLLLIKDWDFRWQGHYRYAEPLKLPAGSRLDTRFVYDNSTNNAHNPNHPPKLVEYGPQTSDEMCEIWLQAAPENLADFDKLKAAVDENTRQTLLDYYSARLQWYPNDPLAFTRLASLLMMEGKYPKAMENLRLALKQNPNFAEAHLELGIIYRLSKRHAQARKELEAATRLDPNSAKAWGHLGFLMAEMGELEEAKKCFDKSFEVDPTDKRVEAALQELSGLIGR